MDQNNFTKEHTQSSSNNATGCTAQDKASESHQLSPAPVPQKRQAPGRPAPPHQHTGQAPPRQHTEQAPPRQQTGQAPPHQHTGQADVDGKAPHKLKQDYQPHPWEPSITKDLPSPHTLKLSLVKPDTVCVTWKHNEEVTDDTKFRITWTSKSNNQEYHEVQVPKVTIKDLVATEEYEFKVAYLSADRRRCSPNVSKTISTGVPAPEKLLVDSVTATSANVSWSLADKMRQRPHRFLIYYWSEDDDPESISTESYTTDITGLTPETEYHLSISTVLHGEPSKAVETHFFTDDVSNSQLTGALPESKQTTLSRVWTFYTVAPGKAQNIVQHISKWLKERHMKEEESPEECDFILAVCPIVSRLATDFEAILKMIPGSHPAILVVVHHTFRPDYVVPDSKKLLGRSDILLVDLLFDEDQGFLHCSRNNIAFDTMMKWIRDNIYRINFKSRIRLILQRWSKAEHCIELGRSIQVWVGLSWEAEKWPAERCAAATGMTSSTSSTYSSSSAGSGM
ncbi:uncharacterized protein LOC121689969 [Alosa sapidissima]|uniref:uncharacterized protein LOC121689969 n=1 Tax=Alosa sapidissima TaxID=34773 RepID=UPI001C0851CF|nr:uncharacterized protein LOC121689969 [Alosa sapidissima]